MEIIDYVIYAIIIVVLIRVCLTEAYQTTLTPDNDRTAYFLFKANEGDNYETLIEKMYNNVRYHYTGIIWRTNLIAAIIFGFILMYIVDRKLPSALNLVIAIITIYGALFVVHYRNGKYIAEPSIKQSEEIKHILREM